MLHEKPDLAYYQSTHVLSSNGERYEIFPLSGNLGKFLLVHEDGGKPIVMTQDQLDQEDFQPVDHMKTVEVDPGTDFPKDLYDQMEQMRCGTQSLMDWQEEDFPE